MQLNMCFGKLPAAAGTVRDYKRQFVPCCTRAGMTPGSQAVHNAVIFMLRDYPPAQDAAQIIYTIFQFSCVRTERLNELLQLGWLG